jgi:hypothetical protein
MRSTSRDDENPMNEREVLFLLDADDAILWSDASQSPIALPDSRARWEAIWRLRERLAEIAHTHPIGPAAFSREDETTMTALDAALGRALRYSVVTPSTMIRRDASDQRVHTVDPEPWWTPLIRAASGLLDDEEKKEED